MKTLQKDGEDFVSVGEIAKHGSREASTVMKFAKQYSIPIVRLRGRAQDGRKRMLQCVPQKDVSGLLAVLAPLRRYQKRNARDRRSPYKSPTRMELTEPSLESPEEPPKPPEESERATRTAPVMVTSMPHDAVKQAAALLRAAGVERFVLNGAEVTAEIPATKVQFSL